MPATIYSLPPELLALIFAYLGPSSSEAFSVYYVPIPGRAVGFAKEIDYKQRQKDLRNLCLTSKWLSANAKRQLYSHVSFYELKDLFTLFRTMVVKPETADLIKSVNWFVVQGHVDHSRRLVPLASPLIVEHLYPQFQDDKAAAAQEGFRRRGRQAGFDQDLLLSQQQLMRLEYPTQTIFAGFLQLASRLETLLFEAVSTRPRSGSFAHLGNIVAAAVDRNRADPRAAPCLEKLRTVQFHHYSWNSSATLESIPRFITVLAQRPQVTFAEFTGLPQSDTIIPRVSDLLNPSGLMGILVKHGKDNVSELSRLELAFSNSYHWFPAKKIIGQYLLPLSKTLKHLSVTFIGDTNGRRSLLLLGRPLNTPFAANLANDWIDTLPRLTSLEHLEVDLHSLFGWSEVFAMDAVTLTTTYPDRKNPLLLRQAWVV